MKKQTYQIYGRKSYETPLTQQETMTFEQVEDLQTTVLATYPDNEWIELIAIPTEKMIWVTQKGKKV